MTGTKGLGMFSADTTIIGLTTQYMSATMQLFKKKFGYVVGSMDEELADIDGQLYIIQ